MKQKILSLVIASAICCHSQMYPLSENTAKIGSFAGGTAAGVGTGLITYFVILKQSNMDPTVKAIVSSLAGVGVGGLTWWILDSILTSMTPTAKFKSASKIIAFIELDSLVSRNFGSSEELVNHVNTRFGTSWPLAIARNHTQGLINDLSHAHSILQSVYNEIQSNPEYLALRKQCKELENRINPIAKTIEDRLQVIVGNDKYQFQVKLHEQHVEAERQRAHEKSQKSSEMLHDSWQKMLDRDHERREKQKDRDHKDKILHENPNRPTILNV